MKFHVCSDQASMDVVGGDITVHNGLHWSQFAAYVLHHLFHFHLDPILDPPIPIA